MVTRALLVALVLAGCSFAGASTPRSGYYTDISAAGRYTYAQAMEICGLRSPGGELPPRAHSAQP